MSHDHGSGGRAGARYRRPLAITFASVVVFMAVETVTALLANSLALLSDAGHMLTDAVGLGMALAAITAASRAEGNGHYTFGLYRLEILAALANAALLLGVGAYVLYEAAGRFQDPPDVIGAPVLGVAVGGLVVNLTGLWLLRAGSHQSLNLQGAYVEVLADLLGSVAVVIAAAVMITTGWPYADPLFGAAIGVFILPRAVRLGRQALRTTLEAIEGVVDVHDLHVWTLTSEMDVASLHLRTRERTDPHPVLDQARSLLRDRYGIAHATLQVEPESHEGCAEIRW